MAEEYLALQLQRFDVRARYSELEAYSKLIAMTVVGVEEAVGEALTGGFVNLVARKLEELLSIPKFSNVKDVLEWFNSNTVFRVNTYRVGGRLVRSEKNGKAFYLVAYECPVRQVLYIEDLPGGKSLCKIMCRLLSKKLSEAAGGRCSVEPARMGPNACLLRVGIEDRLENTVETVDVVSKKPSLEEYEKLLSSFLSAMLKSIGWALYQVLGGNPAMSYRAGKSYGRLVGASILARGYEAESLEEAVEMLNSALEGVVKVELNGDKVRVVESRFKDIVLKEGIEHPEFIDRTVQGFIAGILESLMGRRVDLRSTGVEAEYKVMMGG